MLSFIHSSDNMVSVTKTPQWGGFSTERQTSITWMQRWSIWRNTIDPDVSWCHLTFHWPCKIYVCWAVYDCKTKSSRRSRSLSQILRRWSEYVVSCWRSWTRVFVLGHHSSTTVLNTWVKWGTKKTRLSSTVISGQTSPYFDEMQPF